MLPLEGTIGSKVNTMEAIEPNFIPLLGYPKRLPGVKSCANLSKQPLIINVSI
jgi:hypothetical protein